MPAEPLTPAIIKDTIQRHWSGRAATYDDDTDHGLHSEAQRLAWLALIRRWAGAEALDALDVGCATGFLALHLAGLGHRVAAIDGAEAMLTVARGKADRAGLAVDFRLADAAELPFDAASLDLVIERHVLWTLPDPGAALADWARVLRPGGRLVLVEVQNRDYDRESGRTDYAPISGALPLLYSTVVEITPLVEGAGFVDLVVEPLTDEVLWGGRPENSRCALLARKPN